MKSELEDMGFKKLEDYGDMEWNIFKTEHPEKVDTLVAARTKVLAGFSLKEDRLGAVKVLCDFWHNRRKKHNCNENNKAEQEALARAGQNDDNGGENPNSLGQVQPE